MHVFPSREVYFDSIFIEILIFWFEQSSDIEWLNGALHVELEEHNLYNLYNL